jgi:competence ComEA-like helix-hairpin-helix protein
MTPSNRLRLHESKQDEHSAPVGDATVCEHASSKAPHAYSATAGWLSFTLTVLSLFCVVSVVRWLGDWALPQAIQREDAAAKFSSDLQFQIDVNSATSAQLQALPDIGPTLAERIVSTRNKQGRFETPEDLLSVRGFGPATLQGLRTMLYFDTPPETAKTNDPDVETSVTDNSTAPQQASSQQAKSRRMDVETTRDF